MPGCKRLCPYRRYERETINLRQTIRLLEETVSDLERRIDVCARDHEEAMDQADAREYELRDELVASIDRIRRRDKRVRSLERLCFKLTRENMKLQGKNAEVTRQATYWLGEVERMAGVRRDMVKLVFRDNVES